MNCLELAASFAILDVSYLKGENEQHESEKQKKETSLISIDMLPKQEISFEIDVIAAVPGTYTGPDYSAYPV
jgi:hypothetical protein